MTSEALVNLDTRLKDVDQLLKAHEAITKFNLAASVANSDRGNQLVKAAEVLTALVSQPGPGRPREVDALNRAAFVLSTAHFQGFVEDIHQELGHIMLEGRASNPAAIIKLVRPGRSNPHVTIIDQMFAGIGIYDLMSSISWQRCPNKTVKSRLTKYLETRNKIAHGSKESITKNRVTELKRFIEILARQIDSKAAYKAEAILGRAPW